jgi:DNA-binding IclR family transcriptional regulator
MADEIIVARPGAPALEKGLDVLELLAAEAGGLTQKQVAERVGRSVSEIYRMLGVLEQRGYVTRDRRTGEYMLTLQLFRLATQYPPTRRLQQAALPVMEALAATINLSCHLSVISGTNFMVAATAEPDWPMGWTVKLGAVFPLSMQYSSARILAAFQLEGRREELAAIIAKHDGAPLADIRTALATIIDRGGDFGAPEMAQGVTSLSCPILDTSGRAVAALTTPMLREVGKVIDEAGIAIKLRDAARRVSGIIGGIVGHP